MERIEVGTVGDLDEKSVLRLSLPDGRAVTVAVLADGEYAAFEGLCPHKGAPITEGRICEDVVICPWHAFRFDLRSGEPVGTPSIMKLSVLPVTVESDRIFVTITK
ncbi:Rieske (2Fe-2S) protein [Streptomyces coeruleorubidus]|uniref:Rieske (2Fe-2S) protein n=1 Tax=Streptomyces coeruleorubidus TaxID=116188 RepID=UPI0036FC71E1